MAFYRTKFTTELHNARLVSKRAKRILGILLACCALLFSGCGTLPTQSKEVQTLWKTPVKVTRISLPGGFDRYYTNVQTAAGFVWATDAGLFNPKTIRIDPKSNEVIELSRPRSDGPNDFLVDENSIWYTDGKALLRVDMATNEVAATIEDVGIPFALGDGAVWTYNRETQIVSGIETDTNQVRTQLAVPGRPYHPGSFAYGAGSLWQFTYEGNVSLWQDLNLYGDALSSIVRRIDPYTKKIIAEIHVGLFTNIVDPYVSPYRIYFVADDIWILGRSGEPTSSNPGHIDPFAKRIDVETNRLTATISLTGGHSKPITPVFQGGGLWISVHCGKAESELLKIDLQMNHIDGVFTLHDHGIFEPVGFFGPGFLVTDPQLTVTGDSLWGIDRSTAIRVDF